MLETLNKSETLEVMASMMSAAIFAALGAMLFTLVWRKDIGHKRLLWFGTVFCVAQMLKHLSSARDVVFLMATVDAAAFRFGCACVQSACLVYFLAVVADIVVTLRRSETINRIVKHQEANKEQMSRDIEHVSKQAKQDSGAMLARRVAR